MKTGKRVREWRKKKEINRQGREEVKGPRSKEGLRGGERN
jgi:hypothetical protein